MGRKIADGWKGKTKDLQGCPWGSVRGGTLSSGNGFHPVYHAVYFSNPHRKPLYLYGIGRGIVAAKEDIKGVSGPTYWAEI